MSRSVPDPPIPAERGVGPLAPQRAARSILLVVLPYRIGIASEDATRKKVRSYLAFPYGVLTIASHLKRSAQNLGRLEVLDLNLPSDRTPGEQFDAKFGEMRPDVVGFSLCYDVSYPSLRDLASRVKRESPGTWVVVGGPAVTTGYDEILQECPDIDACCFREGEIAVQRLVDAESVEEALAQDPWVTRAKPRAREVYGDLDVMVDVDYELVDVRAYSMKESFSPFMRYTEASRQFFIVTSRGCPFKCVFCAEPSFHGAGMRYVSVDKVVQHVSMLKDKYGLSVLTIYDDQILMNHPRAKELFRRLAPLDIRIEMPNGVTLSYIDREMAEAMRAGGVDTVCLAIEHGSARVLKDIIKKPIAVKKIRPTIDILHDVGIYCQGFFVIGLPGERPEERAETRDRIIEWDLDWASFSFATPLRGSELYRECKTKGWIDPKYLPIGAVDMTRYVLTAPGMVAEEIERFVFETNLDVNFVNNRRMRVGDYQTARRTFAELVDRFPTHALGHYYLSQCETVTGGNGMKSYKQYWDLIRSDAKWRGIAEKFGLEVGNELEEAEAPGRPGAGGVRDHSLGARPGL